MTRHAVLDEQIAVLRALAVLNQRGAGELRITESSRHRPMPGSKRGHLDIEFDRDDFWRAVAELRERGAIRTEKLFQKNLGPGEVENVE